MRSRFDLEPSREVHIEQEEHNPPELLGWLLGSSPLNQHSYTSGQPTNMVEGSDCLTHQIIWYNTCKKAKINIMNIKTSIKASSNLL